MNYEKAVELLHGRDSKKIGNNTYLKKREDEKIAVLYHKTDIVVFQKDGSTIVNSGGWKTSTTKERINNYVSPGIYQNKGLWYWKGKNWSWSNVKDCKLFTDGDIVNKNGVVISAAKKGDVEKNTKLRKMILKFSKLCASKVPLESPGPGDCWYCSTITDKKESLGDCFKDTSHLMGHMEEGYVVPSLVFQALKERGATDFILSCVFCQDQRSEWVDDLAKREIPRAVSKFMYRRFGLPS